MKIVLLAVVLIMSSMNLPAQEKKLFNGFDGGMMIHTGYIFGNFRQSDYPVSGMPFGMGGLLGDFYWIFGRFMPYIGLTLRTDE